MLTNFVVPVDSAWIECWWGRGGMSILLPLVHRLFSYTFAPLIGFHIWNQALMKDGIVSVTKLSILNSNWKIVFVRFRLHSLFSSLSLCCRDEIVFLIFLCLMRSWWYRCLWSPVHLLCFIVEQDGTTVKVSKASGHPVVWMTEENYMFRLSSFQGIFLAIECSILFWIV